MGSPTGVSIDTLVSAIPSTSAANEQYEPSECESITSQLESSSYSVIKESISSQASLKEIEVIIKLSSWRQNKDGRYGKILNRKKFFCIQQNKNINRLGLKYVIKCLFSFTVAFI